MPESKGYKTPTTGYVSNAAVFFANTGITSGTPVMVVAAASDMRTMGVWIRNDTANVALVSNASAGDYTVLPANSDANNSMWVITNGEVWVKAQGSNVDVSGYSV